MFSTLADYLGRNSKPTGLPTHEGVALEKACSDAGWEEYFGEYYFHNYWHGGKHACSADSPCGAGFIVYGGNFVSALILIVLSIIFYNSGIGIRGYAIWIAVAATMSGISLGVPIFSTFRTRNRIYRKYLNEYNIERVWEQTVSPILRDMTNKQYNREIADLEDSLKPEQDALIKAEEQKKFVACLENPVSDRETTLEDIDKIIVETKATIAEVQARIGDAKVAKGLALSKILELESHAKRASHGDDMSKINVLAVINNLATGAGLAPVALPSEAVERAILVDSLLRDEIRKDRKIVNQNIISGKEDVDLTKVQLPTSGTAAVKA